VKRTNGCTGFPRLTAGTAESDKFRYDGIHETWFNLHRGRALPFSICTPWVTPGSWIWRHLPSDPSGRIRRYADSGDGLLAEYFRQHRRRLPRPNLDDEPSVRLSAGRPGRRRCTGNRACPIPAPMIWSAFHWHCPVCNDNGFISGWQNTLWDGFAVNEKGSLGERQLRAFPDRLRFCGRSRTS